MELEEKINQEIFQMTYLISFGRIVDIMLSMIILKNKEKFNYQFRQNVFFSLSKNATQTLKKITFYSFEMFSTPHSYYLKYSVDLSILTLDFFKSFVTFLYFVFPPPYAFKSRMFKIT